MAPLGWAGSLSQGIAGSARVAPAQAWNFQEGRRLPTTMRAQGNHAHRKETTMRFYRHHNQYRFYCGVDLHARCMYLCILDADGQTVLHQNYPADARAFLDAVAPFRDGLAVAVECMFAWYWLADLCAEQGIAFVLGHALYMKAIHQG